MNRYVGEVFLVRRGEGFVAEPTGGVRRRAPDAPPQTWFASVDVEVGDVVDLAGPVTAEIEVPGAVPDSGQIGRVVQLSSSVRPVATPLTVPIARRDEAADLLELVPDAWLPYEVRVGELPGRGWEAFVGTLFPVPRSDFDAALGVGWAEIVRMEPWLRPCRLVLKI